MCTSSDGHNAGHENHRSKAGARAKESSLLHPRVPVARGSVCECHPTRAQGNVVAPMFGHAPRVDRLTLRQIRDPRLRRCGSTRRPEPKATIAPPHGRWATRSTAARQPEPKPPPAGGRRESRRAPQGARPSGDARRRGGRPPRPSPQRGAARTRAGGASRQRAVKADAPPAK